LPAVETLEIQPSDVEPDIQVLVDQQTKIMINTYGLNVEEAGRVRVMTVKGAKGMSSP